MPRSLPSPTLVERCCAVIFFGIVTFVFEQQVFRWVHLIFLFPMLVLTSFYATLAVVEVSNEAIRYRRISRWRDVSFDEVRSCGRSSVGVGIGYLRLKRLLWPWGRLYFTLDDPSAKGIGVIGFIRERIHSDPMSNGDRKEDKKSRISFAVIWCLFLSAIVYLSHGHSSMRYPSEPSRSAWPFFIFLFSIASVASIYVWWVNRRDSK